MDEPGCVAEISGPDARSFFSWGANSYGQLSTGNQEDQLLPRETTLHASVESISQVTGGGGHTLIVTDNGDLWMCGSNSRGQLGVGHCDCLSTLTRVVFLGGDRVTRADGGWDFSLSITEDGALYAWGSNGFGQLGLPGEKGPVLLPMRVSSLKEPVTFVTSGLRHSAALTASGRVYVWGSGKKGQLGLTSAEGIPRPNVATPTPVDLCSSWGRPVQVCAGSMHTVVLTDVGYVVVWGCNKYGQGATNPKTAVTITKPRKIELPLMGKDRVVSIAAGWTHNICLTEWGRVLSWGRGDYGQLGRPCADISCHTPDFIPTLSQVSQVACGAEHNLAITDGTVWSWGWGEHGMLGSGSEDNMKYPHAIGQLSKKRACLIGCGAGHSFALIDR